MKSQLKNRTLFYDGTVLVDPSAVPGLLLSGVNIQDIRVERLDDDLTLYNLIADVEIKAGAPDEINIDTDWAIPEEYKQIDLVDYLDKALKNKIPKAKQEVYAERVREEMVEVDKRNIRDIFKAIIFAVDTLRDNEVVWGVGRGSSCSSLILFLLDLHKVDPIKYQIPMSEFFHD